MFDLLVVSQEKTIQNIEGFDKSKLKHAETAEKVVSPSESKFMFSVGRKTVVCALFTEAVTRQCLFVSI